MSFMMSGVAACHGVVTGRARVVAKIQPEIQKIDIKAEHIEYQVKRFKQAHLLAKQQLAHIHQRIPEDISPEIIEFIDTHLLMLEDKALTLGPIQIIQEEHCNAEWALQQQRDKLVDLFDEIEDNYLRTRKDDIDHIINQLQTILRSGPSFKYLHQSHFETSPHILITENINPTEMILLKAQHCIALVTEHGGPTSHTAILARSLNIPTVMNVQHICSYICDRDLVIVDGSQGVIIVNPDIELIKFYQQKSEHIKAKYHHLLRDVTTPTETKEGQRIQLYANIDLPMDISVAKSVCAEGIGLYRTECMFLGRNTPPDEQEQFMAYRDICAQMAPHTVTIRTMDFGNDKSVDIAWLDTLQHNPVLGLRAIRLCLHHPELFKPQLRAILRASALGPVKLLLPLLSSVDELQQVFILIDAIKAELTKQHIAFDSNLPVGGMVEVPSAAIAADIFAERLDFLAIGTNDLIQYTLAIDRDNDAMNYLYNPCDPAVLRLIKNTIDAGKKAGKPVSLCGEMASEPYYTRLLLGLGLTLFSIHPSSMLDVRAVIQQSSIDDALLRRVDEILHARNVEEAKRIMALINQGIVV